MLHLVLLYHLQHGFRRFKSCESQLIEFVSDIVDNSPAKQTDIMLDFSMTFSKVPHNFFINWRIMVLEASL